jgi:hypothetical protein
MDPWYPSVLLEETKRAHVDFLVYMECATIENGVDPLLFCDIEMFLGRLRFEVGSHQNPTYSSF